MQCYMHTLWCMDPCSQTLDMECNCIQAWNPYLRKDVDMLEKIQRRATKLIPGLRDLTYEERLNECGLTLETRRLRGDQIVVFKILNG